MTEYERGYRDGVSHFKTQLAMISKDLRFIRDKRGQMAFFLEAKDKPKPGVSLWLVLDNGIITEGFYLDGRYIAMSGLVVEPKFWALIPDTIRPLTGSNDVQTIPPLT